MQHVPVKAGLAAGWVLLVCIVGLIARFDSVSSWAILAFFAVVPPVVMMWKWNDPPQSLSESIQKARR